jgi:hypothetical protein
LTNNTLNPPIEEIIHGKINKAINEAHFRLLLNNTVKRILLEQIEKRKLFINRSSVKLIIDGSIKRVQTLGGYHDLVFFVNSYKIWWAAEKIQLLIAPFREVKNIRFSVGVMSSQDRKVSVSEGFCGDCCY